MDDVAIAVAVVEPVVILVPLPVVVVFVAAVVVEVAELGVGDAVSSIFCCCCCCCCWMMDDFLLLFFFKLWIQKYNAPCTRYPLLLQSCLPLSVIRSAPFDEF
jgi:hypothetical protein